MNKVGVLKMGVGVMISCGVIKKRYPSPPSEFALRDKTPSSRGDDWVL